MGLLKEAGQVEFLKAGFLGFNGTGKSFTMALLAVAVKRHFGLPGRIAMYDTEGGSEYVDPIVQELTGQKLLVIKSRSLDDLGDTVAECIAEHHAVLMAESMTHVWRNLCDAYLARVNEERAKRNRPARGNLVLPDWTPLKKIWADRWGDVYLNAPLHILVAGRAGYEYDNQEDPESEQTRLVKTGVKMRTEGEFGFEPSLLVEMDREQVLQDKVFVTKRRATVIKDRFAVIDAKSELFEAATAGPALERVWAFFRPHVERLKAGTHTPIDLSTRTQTGADEDGDSQWARERKTRTILAEEIAGALVKYGLDGQGREEKKLRLDLLESVFGTRSWTAIESTESAKLRAGLRAIREKYEQVSVEDDDDTLECRLLASNCAVLENRLGDLARQADIRLGLEIGGLDTATHDQLVAYRDALTEAVDPKGVSA